MKKFDENLLKIIVCPKTGKDLVYDKKKNNLRTPDGKNTYKIKNGIPILIIRDSI